MSENISTKGDSSPVIIGNNNKTKWKNLVSVKQKWAYGLGGFITGVLTSLFANWIWHFFC